MTGRLVVVTGTGTNIGKTHLACALARCWGARGARIAAIKPIESGSAGPLGPDSLALAAHATFHVKHPPPYVLRMPVAPARAADEEGIAIDVPRVCEWVREIRLAADGVVLELPGGLFSPVAPKWTNAELLLALQPNATVLVAPDRLGTLHDCTATLRAASAQSIVFSCVCMVEGAAFDESTGRNAEDLCDIDNLLPVVEIPRGTIEELSLSREVARALERCLRDDATAL